MVEETQRAQAKKNKVEDEQPADEAYLTDLKKQFKKAGLDIKPHKLQAFLAAQATKLAHKEQGRDFQSTLHSIPVKRLKNRAKELQADLRNKQATLQKVQL